MKSRKSIALIMVIAMLAGLFAACAEPVADQAPASSAPASSAAASSTAGSEAAPAEQAEPLKVFYTKGGAEAPPENDIIHAKMEEDSGIKFEFISPPSANYTEQLHLMLASGEYPDIVAFQVKTEPFTYNEEDIFLDLAPYKDLMPNINGLIPQTAMDYYNVDGKQIAIPKWTTTKRYNLSVRGDWLKKLNLEVPTTLEEFHDVAKAFTEQDPDGNGQKDTTAISGLGLDSFDYIFGAFGTIMGEANWNAQDTHCNIYFKDVDGKLVPYAVLPEMKEALTLLSEWYAEGLIDPEYVSQKNNIWEERYEQSRFGFTTSWWGYEPRREMAMIDAVPDIEILTIAPPTGPRGESGLRAVPEVVSCVTVMKTTKYPELCAKFLDYFHDEEDGMMTSYTGVKDIHWEHTADDKYLTLPQFDVDNKWIQWYFLFENEQPLYKVETFLAQSRRDALKWNVIRDYADGMSVPAQLTYQADLTALCAEVMNDIITGKKPISDFDKFAEDFMSQGGQEWTDQVNELYAAKK